MTLLKLGLAALLAATAALPAVAQEGKDFFNGKTVNYIVSTDPGGGYDTNGRLVAQYMQKYLPGSTFIVLNKPGAGHLIGANFIYASEPDGLTIGTFNTGLIYNQIIGKSGVKFDLGKMSWIGKVASEPRVIVVSKQSGVNSMQDLLALKEPLKFGGAGVGSASYVETTMLKDALNLPVSVITGYNGNDDQLALRRGEIQGIIASRSTFEQFVKDGYGKFVAQIGGKQTDVPQLSTFATDEKAKAAVALIESQSDISRLTAGPRDIPADRLQALRDAYAAALADPEFKQKAASLQIALDPMVGDPLAKAIEVALDQPPATVDLLKQTLKKK